MYLVLVPNAAPGNKPAVNHKQNVNADNLDDETDTLSFQFQIGSAKYPDNPCEGVGEAYFRLQQAIGVAYNHDDIGITPDEFIGYSAVFGCDLERCGN